jgi:outer membrane protein TolC
MLLKSKIVRSSDVWATGLQHLFFGAVCLVFACRVLADSIASDTNSTSEKKLSLKAAIQLALENNHQIKAFAYSVSATQQDVGIASSELLPKIAIEENLTRTDTPAYVFSSKLNQGRFSSADLAGAPGTFNHPGYLNDYQTEFSIEQPIFAPSAWIGLDIAGKQSQAKSEEFQRAREQIVYRVVAEFLTVQTAGEIITTALNSVQDANEHLRISQVRYDANLGLYSDVLRATTAQKQAQQNLITAQKNLSLAKRSLGMAIGTQDSFDIEPEFPQITIKQSEYYTASALARRDLKSMQTKLEVAQKNIDLAKADYLPVMGLRGAYQLDDHSNVFGSEGDSWFGGIFLKWYLFEGAKRDSQVSKAKYELAKTRENMAELENAIAFKVYQAWLTVEEAQKNVQLASSALETAQEGERLVRKRYENSLSPLVDLLDTQVMLDNARSTLVAKKNEYHVAAITLFFESGTILNDLNLEQ